MPGDDQREKLMSPDDFIAKWQGVTLTERASAPS
jgi:hypothetical protein